MADKIKHVIPIIGDTAANDSYTGPLGEITVDTTQHTLRIHDGVTMGGHTLWSTKSYIPYRLSELENNAGFLTKNDIVTAASIAERDSKSNIICDTYIPRSGGELLGNLVSFTLGKTRINLSKAASNEYIALSSGGYEFKIPAATGAANYNGTITANAVYNATWNDYAEFFERGECTEVGDIIALDCNSEREQYIKASCSNNVVVGVHSDTFGHLIGGENPPEGEDFVQYNLPKFIPVGLNGRVMVKVDGIVRKGDKICLSQTPGVGVVGDQANIVGIAVQDKHEDGIGLVKIVLKV